MIGIIVLSHGPLAKGLIESYKFFHNDEHNITYLCLNEEDNPILFRQQIIDQYHFLDTDEGVLILCDIPGGSPANQAQIVAQEYKNIRIISGMNLLMLLDAALSRSFMNIDELCDHIQHSAKESICLIQNSSDNEDDQMAVF